MDKNKKTAMFAYMSANDDDDMPDGAWQAMLEDAAEEWGSMNGIEVDGYDAFMEYIQEAK